MGTRREIPVVQPDPVRILDGSFPTDSLDLHGLEADREERNVRVFVEAWCGRQPGAVLR